MDRPTQDDGNNTARDEARMEKKRWRTPVLLVADMEQTGAKAILAAENAPPGFGPAS